MQATVFIVDPFCARRLGGQDIQAIVWLFHRGSSQKKRGSSQASFSRQSFAAHYNVKMASAEALANISAVLSAPSEPVGVVILRADGTVDAATIDHRKVGELLQGTPTVCGAIRALNAQAVCLRAGKGKANAHSLPNTFEPKIKGDIVLLRTASDAAGSPMALALQEYTDWVAAGRPDGEDSDEEEDGEEFGEEESGEEGEGEGESGEDGEESGEEEEEIDWDSLPADELRKACEMVGVETEGSKKQLIERLIAHAKVETGDFNEEEGEAEEGTEEAEEEAPKGKRAAGSAGPSKAGGISKATKRGRK